MKKRTRIGALLMAVVMIFSLTTVSFAEAGQWDPLTDPDTVKGTLYDYKTSYASTQFERGKPGALRMMPTYTEGGYVYNASAYCGATATSDNPDVVEVKTKDGHQDIVIGKWVGGIWDGADCLQVNVDAKKAGTATVQVNFYYTFTQNNDPFNHPKALWIYGTCYYTVTVTDTSQQDITLTYDGNGSGVTNVPAQQKQNVEQGDSATFTISSTIPVRSGFDFLGWADSATATAAEYHGGNSLTTNTSKTIYAVWKTHEHSDKNGDGFCDTDNKCMHPKDPNGYCTVEGCTHPNSCCPKKEGPKPPTEPTGTPTFTDVNGQIRVQCTAYPSNHEPHALKYGITSKDDYTVIGQAQKGDMFTYSIELKRASFIDKFDAATKREHEDVEPNEKAIVTWRWDDDKWNLISGPDGITADIKCICKKEIEPPTDVPTDDDVKAALGNLWVKCINGPKTGSNCTPCKWPAKLGYSGSDSLTKVSDTEYTVELGVDVFVNAYTKRAGEEHGLMSAKTLTWVLTFTEGKWVGEPKEAGVDDIIQTAHRVPVHVVIYRNGDTSQAYADIALNSELPGTVIDLTKLKIGDYYQGDVEFYGWYNDGKWNEYTKDLANPPAGLERITVNGWTNLKCMVYDLDKVVYFQSAEDLAAYQKDHSKNDGRLYTTTVRRGTTLPTADAPAATREGYTFQYWSREGQYQDVTGQTVSGWTNLYAAWTPNTDTPYKVEHYKQKLDGTYVKADTDELTGTTDTRATAVAKSYTGFTVDKTVEGTVESGIIAGNGSLVLKLYYTRNSYIISSDLRINGDVANLADGKTYPWSHRYGGKFEETIDYQPMIDALKARAMQVDAANEPYSVDIKLCFPGTQDPANATPYNETILTYGQTGGGWNPGVKNTAYIWGYATTSYEVIFKAENGTEIGTKIVEYGKTVASADPGEKYGYNFVGWVDQDGNAFTFDNDGNSVTEITRKTVLTAQWAKKVYTIGPDLRINGGEPVKAPGKNYSWSPRYSGEYQDVIDYDKVFEDLTAKVEEVDKDNEPSKIEIKLCFPGKTPATTDEGGLFNEVITYFGQEGASWNPGVKNTAYIWGYATTYYDVSFDSNGGTAVDTQKNVQYGTTATKPENPTREGYRFLGWFTKDGEAFDFSTPITKSMTLTAKWEIVNINAYIIPITSDGTQLVGAGFDMALNTTTLSRVGLPGYEDEDAVRIHFATFASSAGLADADEYFPGTDPLVVKAVADLKNGLERRFAAGVNEAKADGIMSKTNWTYLHVGELDDEEDTNFLSGNLVFYSARFVTEDSEHVTGMPNPEYTHNAVAVYDYYLDGETITIPDAVPERYGYDFLGWSVKAVPAENDKLLKAGDTVTVDGDVVFTAQWKLKEYTVSFDSKGGTKVDSQIVEHGSTATKPGNPHRNDYTFKGWYLDGKKFDFSTPITGDITLVARWATKTSGGSNSSSDTTTKDNGKTVQSGKTFDGGIALYVGLSVLSATGSALVITKKKRG